jgi:hypothetical protein
VVYAPVVVIILRGYSLVRFALAKFALVAYYQPALSVKSVKEERCPKISSNSLPIFL